MVSFLNIIEGFPIFVNLRFCLLKSSNLLWSC